MFMRVNSKCAHQVRPPRTPLAARKPPRPGTHAVRLRHESERSGRSTADQRMSMLSRGWNAGRAYYYSPALQVTEETPVISPHPLLGEPTVIIEWDVLAAVDDFGNWLNSFCASRG